MYTGIVCYNRDGTISLQRHMISDGFLRGVEKLRRCFPHLVYGDYDSLQQMLTVSTDFKPVCPHCTDSWYLVGYKDIKLSDTKQEVLHIRNLLFSLYKAIAIYKSLCLSEKLRIEEPPFLTMSGQSLKDTEALYDYCQSYQAYKYCVVLFKDGSLAIWNTAVAAALSEDTACNFLIIMTGTEPALRQILDNAAGGKDEGDWHVNVRFLHL